MLHLIIFLNKHYNNLLLPKLFQFNIFFYYCHFTSKSNEYEKEDLEFYFYYHVKKTPVEFMEIEMLI